MSQPQPQPTRPPPRPRPQLPCLPQGDPSLPSVKPPLDSSSSSTTSSSSSSSASIRFEPSSLPQTQAQAQAQAQAQTQAQAQRLNYFDLPRCLSSSLSSSSLPTAPLLPEPSLRSLSIASDPTASSILLDLDQNFQAFRSAFLQDPQPLRLSRFKDQLVASLDIALNHALHQPVSLSSAIRTPASLLSLGTPSLAYPQPHNSSYFPHQVQSTPDPPRQPVLFPLKLERKRSRERLDGERSSHHPKAARSDGSTHSSAAVLSRRTSQVAISSPPGSASNPSISNELTICGLLSPSSSADPPPQPPIPTKIHPSHLTHTPATVNPLKPQFVDPNHHPSNPYSLSQSTQASCDPFPPKPPCESPNTLHLPSTRYPIPETPLTSPQDFSIPSASDDQRLKALISSHPNPSLNHQPDPSLGPNERLQVILDSIEARSTVEETNTLRVQFSDMMTDISYPTLPDTQPIDLASSSSNLDLTQPAPSSAAGGLNPSNLVEPSESQVDPTKVRVIDPGDRDDRDDRVGSPPTRASPSSIRTLQKSPPTEFQSHHHHHHHHHHQADSPKLDLGSLSDSLNNQSAFSISKTEEDPTDQTLGHGLINQELVKPPIGLLSSEQSSDHHRHPPAHEPSSQSNRSRAGTMDSTRSSVHALFAELESPTKETQSTTQSRDLVIQLPLPGTSFRSTPSSTLATPVDGPIFTSSSTPYPTHPHDDQQTLLSQPPRVPSPPVNKQMGAASAGVSDELAAQFEPIFTNWLGRLCSDLDMKDSKGESIHQTLMARKMQRLEESADFRPFKFRIQAFTNSFFEELVRHGFNEKDLPMKKVRQYLWSQSCISRFNEEGKKAKSKGNHVWHIEAQKISSGQWNFLHFQRKIIGPPPSEAYVGLKYVWTAKIWDPQCSAQNMKAVFTSPELPPWLSWRGNVLSGTPGPEAVGLEYEIVVIATTNYTSRRSSLNLKFKLSVKSSEEMDLIQRSSGQEESMPVSQSDSNPHSSSFEQASFEDTPHQSPDEPSKLSGARSAPGTMISGGLLPDSVDASKSNQPPCLSRNDSDDNLTTSPRSLEDLSRQSSSDQVLTGVNLMGGFVVTSKEADRPEFDSANAANILQGMNQPTTDAVVNALGQFNKVPHPGSCQPPIELRSSHSLNLNLNQSITLGSTPVQVNLMSSQNQIGGLADLGIMITANPPSQLLNDIHPSVSTTTTTTTTTTHPNPDVVKMDSDSIDRAGLLEQMMNPTNLMRQPPPPTRAEEVEVVRSVDLSRPNSELITGTNCLPSPVIGGTTTEGVMTMEESNQRTLRAAEDLVAAAQHQAAVALHLEHEARLQTVRDNLMSADAVISGSAGDLIREAIVSDDPIARQFASDVLAPMATTPSTGSTHSTTAIT